MNANDWQPSASRLTIKKRAELLHNIRHYFYTQNVTEVEVPILSSAATVDINIDSFYTPIEDTIKINSKHYYLSTSPEFFMKRLLAADCGDIYTLQRVFRKKEQGRQHNPEFTLLEWYRVGMDAQALMQDTEQLLRNVMPIKHFYHYTYGALFLHFLKINPHSITEYALKKATHKAMDINTEAMALTRNDYLDLLFTACIQPKISTLTDHSLAGIFVYDYPASMSALAQLKTDSHHQVVADRFELFINGMEIANGYYELTDSQEQKKRFIEESQHRQQQQRANYPFDQHLIQALEAGLPSCSGIALGIDRLLMLMLSKQTIDEVLTFPFDIA